MANLLRRDTPDMLHAVMSCVGFICLEFVIIAAVVEPLFIPLVLVALWLEAMVVTDGGR